MSAIELLRHLRAQGIGVALVEGRLRVRAARGLVTDAVRDELRAHGEELKTLLGSVASAPAGMVVPVARDGPLPLSFAQERLWFLAQLEPDSAEYNVPGALELRGVLDVDALRRALSGLVARHEVLRTRFVADGGVPTQVVDPPGPLPLETVDLSDLEPEAARSEASRVLGEVAAHPFDLAVDRLMRAVLVRLDPEDHVLGLVVHHIVSDEWSSRILRRELSVLHAAYANDEPSPLRPLPVQYADFAVWQRDSLSGERLEEQLDYWRHALTGVAPLELPTDRLRPPVRSPAGGSVPICLDPALSEGVRALAREEGASVFMVLLAGFQALLSRWADTEDVALGIPVANRARPEVEDLIGFFVNTLVLRTDLSGDPSFVELIRRVRETALGAYAHQDLPFERLVDDLAPERDPSRHPLFQVMLNYGSAEPDNSPPTSSVACDFAVPFAATPFDLTLSLTGGDSIAGRFEFTSELFDATTVERLGRGLVELLDQALTDPRVPLSDMRVITDDERDELLASARGPTVDPSPVGLVEAVSVRARECPEVAAIVADGVELSYGDLEARASRLAGFLAVRGVGPESVVGVCLERSPELVVALLGVSKAGGAFLVLDPAYPADRLGLMVEAAAAGLVVGSPSTTGWVQDVAVLDVADPGIAALPAEAPDVAVVAESLGWVVFTSGSTGVPKGVGVSRAAMAGLLTGWTSAHGLEPGWRWLCTAPVGTDVFCGDVLRALGTGGTLVLEAPELAAGPGLADAIDDQGIEALEVSPHGLRGLIAAAEGGWSPSGLGLVVVASESFVGAEAAEATVVLGGARVVCGFGLSEASVDSTWFGWGSVPVDPGARVPIGRPLPGVSCHVLDGSLRQVPVGVPGELFIGGIGLARGYLGRPDLTAGRFVADPFGPSGSRLYRAGDRCRWLASGVLEFLGRVDEQLNVRGFRIEPGEVETILGAHSDVSEAVVTARDDALIAYVVADPMPGTTELRGWSGGRLPAHMVPQLFVEMDRLPRLPSGKVDRRALPAPGPPRPEGILRAARNATEEILAGVFAEVLGVERVGIDDNFFDLGGHSLLATRVMARLTAIFGVEISLRAMFETPTVAGLAAAVITGDVVAPVVPTARDGPLPLSFAQERLWFLAQLEPDSAEYNVPGALELRGALDVDALQRALSDLIARHEVLRTRFVAERGVPTLVIDPPEVLPLEMVDLSDLEPAAARAAAQERLACEAARPFDLAHDRLVRPVLVRLDPHDHVLGLVVHHIVSDEWSSQVLRRELSALYAAYTNGEPSPFEPLPVQYADFAVWQRQYLDGERLDEQLGYWRQALTGLTPLELPTDRPRPPVRSPAGAAVPIRLGPELSEQLRALARSEGASVFMVLLAGFQAFLARLCGQDDIAVGTPVANRARPEVEDVVGFFVNTLVLRTDCSGDPSFAELVDRVRETALGAYAHQDLPFERLVEELAPSRDASHHPLFQAMLAYEASDPGELTTSLGDGEVCGMDVDVVATSLDLVLSFAETDGCLTGRFEFATELFDASTVEGLGRGLVELLGRTVADPGVRLSELSLLAEDDRDELLALARGPTPVWASVELPEVVSARAQECPGAAAIVAEGVELSYGDLEARANRLARFLMARGVGAESVVGVCLDRGPDLVVGLLGVLKAGGGFLVLDPGYPPERLRFTAEAADAALVVGSPPLTGWVRGCPVVDIADPGIAALSAEAPDVAVAPESLGWVVFTSGSTGVPKGVGVSRAAMAGLLAGWTVAHGLEAGWQWLSTAPVATDVFCGDVLRALGTGGSLALAAPELAAGPGLAEAVQEWGIGALEVSPHGLRALIAAARDGWASSVLGLVVVASESFVGAEADEATEVLGGARVVCGFGLSEAAVDSTWFGWGSVPVEPGARVPIGRPLPGVSCHVLERSLGQVPVGVPGELFIGGIGLARGYVGRPELTAERFVADPFGSAGSRLYRSGDRCRWLGSGVLEFLGRVDDQLNVRGFRIEPGEVEAALGSHPDVAETAVVARDDALVAYVVADRVPSSTEMRGWLAERLPAHMVLQLFVGLDRLPRLPSGKIDRRALPAPGPQRPEGIFRAPRNAREEILAGVFAEILAVERVGIDDDFFDLGGHSLLATRVMARLTAIFGVEVSLRAMFEFPTVAGLAAAVTTGEIVAPVVPVARDGPLPLSFAQERLWFLAQLEPDSAEYNIPGAVDLHGDLDIDALKRALSELIARHEVLRTRFLADNGIPTQIIDPPQPVEVPVVDLSGLGAEEARVEARQILSDTAARPFNLAEDRLLRTVLLRLGPQDHVLGFVAHHIVSDEWSSQILRRELSALYAAYTNGEPSPFEPLPVQYADFAVWQRHYLSGERLEQQLSYWRQALTGLAPLELPADRPRPPVRSPAGASVPLVFDEALTARLHELARAQGASVFMVLLAGFQALLARICGQEDIAVGAPVANRARPEVEHLVGFFVNTLVLRTDCSGDPTFAELVGRARETALGAYAHQDLPFERLVEELAPDRDPSHHPLFQAMLAYEAPDEDEDTDDEGLAALAEGSVATPGLLVKGDMRLELTQWRSCVTGALEYRTDVFDEATACRIVEALTRVLEAAAADPEVPLSRLPVLGPAELDDALSAWDAGPDDRPVAPPVPELVTAQARSRPDAAAVLVGESSVSYAALDERANRLAHYLQSLGVGPEVVVGVCLDQGLDLVVAVLAVMKAGGAYLSLDPLHPPDRLTLLVDDAGAAVMLSQTSTLDATPTTAFVPLVILDDDTTAAELSAQPDDPPTIGGQDDNLAYVVYTSGSTGTPKGVGVSRRALASYVTAVTQRVGFAPGAHHALLQPPSVDFANTTLFAALATGGVLHLLDRWTATDPRLLAEELGRRPVDFVKLVPSQLAALLDTVGLASAAPRTAMILGGEQLPPTLARELLGEPGLPRVVNHYGPSETTVGVACGDVTADELAQHGAVALGAPLAGRRLVVLDRDLQPVMPGSIGELYIGGDGVARGYLHRPDLTAERFVADPFARDGSRLYRTGDLVRWRGHQRYEFVGRTDAQVKVRGHRVEPAEVEARLVEHRDIVEAAVALASSGTGDAQLLAYLVLRDGAAQPAADELRAHLSLVLPDPMVPSAYLVVDALPRTSSGKLDRRALLTKHGQRVGVQETFVAPRDAVEHTLASLMSDVLQVPRVGVHDDFFELGGHSLLATQLVARVEQVLDVELPLVSVFDHPTVAELAADITHGRRGEPRAKAPPILPISREGPLPLSFAQQRLWFLAQLEPESSEYNIAGALDLRGPLDIPALEAALAGVISRHEVLRTRFSAERGIPRQVVDPPGQAPLTTTDLTGHGDAAPQAAMRLAAELAAAPFDLATGPVLRAHVLQLADDHHLLVLVVHHIAADEWSIAILRGEIQELYQAERRRRSADLPPLPVQYADYASWQQGWMSGERLDEELQYWQTRLSDLTPLALPTDRARPPRRSGRGDAVSFEVPATTVDGLHQVARGASATLFMTLLAGFQALLSRLAGEEDIAVGTPVANRARPDVENLVGLFLNTVVIRTDCAGDPSFAELLGRVRERALEAFEHQDVPFEQVVDAIDPDRDLSRNPLFEVMFTFGHDSTGAEAGLDDQSVCAVELPRTTARFDLTLALTERAGSLAGELEFSLDLWDRPSAEVLVTRFLSVLDAVADGAALRLSELPLLLSDERERMLVDWNQTAGNIPEATVPDLIAVRALQAPGAPAVRGPDGELTYAELEAAAEAVAARLRDLGVARDDVVAVLAERGVGLVVALLGAWQAGAAYLPIDPAWPEHRRDHLLRTSGAVAGVGSAAFSSAFDAAGLGCVVADEATYSAPTRGGQDGLADQAAYVLYTSGSTGEPKGVVVTQRNLVNLLLAMQHEMEVVPGEVMVATTTISFDIAALEIWLPLISGGQVVLGPDSDAGDPRALAALLDGTGATLAQATPSGWRMLLDSGWAAPSTMRVLCGGEALDPSLAARLRAGFDRVWNVYGPTETTVWSTVEQLGDGAVTIGRPLANTVVYVLDPSLQPVPTGAAGELYIGGHGVARGYVGRPDLTAERFVADPVRRDGTRLYRTGDMVRWLADGRLDFLGRWDDQVKVRGHRVELAEIEAALGRVPDVRAAGVTFEPRPEGRTSLAASVVPQQQLTTTRSDEQLAADHVAAWRARTAEGSTDEVATETVARLLGARPQRVLEVACGEDGLIEVIGPPGELFDAAALGTGTWLLPDVSRFETMLAQALDHVTALGVVAVGPVRNLSLVGLEHLWWALQRSQPETRLARVAEAARHSIAHDLELAVHPGFFQQLAEHLGVGPPAVVLRPGSPKDSRSTLFGYDVLLQRSALGEALVEPRWLAYDPAMSLDDLAASLATEADEAVALTDVPNGRLAAPLAVAELVEAGERRHTAREALSWARRRVGEVEPDQLRELASRLGRRVTLTWSSDPSDGRFDALFLPVGDDRSIVRAQGWPRFTPSTLMSNEPARTRAIAEEERQFVHQVRAELEALVPRSMVPDTITVVDRLPRTPNGKLDRSALLTRGDLRTAPARAGRPPVTPTEDFIAATWQDLLGVGDVSAEDDFFDLGGHSLVATRLVSRIREVLGVDLPLRTLFEERSLEDLAARIDGGMHRSPIPAIATIPREGRLPLSFAQQRLWFLDQLQPGTADYNLAAAVRFHGDLDATALDHAFSRLVAHQELLRARFVSIDGTPGVVVDPAAPVSLPLVDLSEQSPEDAVRAAAEYAADEAARPFDLAAGPLLRAALLRLADDDHVLVLCTHHIVSDEWSADILRREISEAYSAALAGEEPCATPLPVQYVDYAAWQREWLQGDELEEQLRYWRSHLAGLQPLQLPTDHPRPAVRTSSAGSVPFALDAATLNPIRHVARDVGASPFMAVLAGFQALLARSTGQNDIAVGTPVANRTRTELENLVGLFVNTLVMRSDLSGDQSFRALLDRVRETAFGAFVHQEVPFERLVDELEPDRDPSRHPLFQVMFNYDTLGPSGGGGHAELAFEPTTTVKFDLRLVVHEQPDGLTGELIYNRDLFERTTAERMTRMFVRLVEAVARDPDVRLSQLPLLDETERTLLDEWGGLAGSAARPDRALERVDHQIEAVVSRTPAATAVAVGEQSLTYGELGSQANNVARYLRSLGIGPGALVGICMPASVDVFVGVLGVLEAGAAYVILDPTLPLQRLDAILRDAVPAVVLVSGDAGDALPASAVPIIDVGLADAQDGVPEGSPARPGDLDDLAYVVYTSGSTGVPKGVMVTHRQLAAYTAAVSSAVGFVSGAHYALASSLAFDFANTMVYPCLTSGGRLSWLTPDEATDQRRLKALLHDGAVDYLKITPTLLAALLASADEPADCVPARALILGGEASPAGWAGELSSARPGAAVFNHYGPTEATVGTSVYRVGEQTGGRTVPIGRPLAHVTTAVLDQDLQPTPVGVVGELYIGGIGVARGYHGDPALTADRFVANPFGHDGERLYRTGDRCRWLSSGDLEFLGRVDEQLKVRGYRVEPGEVEAVLREHPAVNEAAVVGIGADSLARRLGAVVVPDPDAAPCDERTVRLWLSDRLPDFMVPSSIVGVERMPRLANGKVDRTAVADIVASAGTERSTSGRAPRSATERVIASIWAEVLDVTAPSADDDFFDLGGHSLLATQVVARIRQRLGTDLALLTLFENPNLAALAAAVDTLAASLLDQARQRELMPIVLLRPGHLHPALFCVHPSGGTAFCYRALAAHLGDGQQFVGLQAGGLEAEGEALDHVEQMAERYVRAARVVQPEGPYVLAGYSMGAFVAWEMARRLQAEGAEVARLMLIAPSSPRGRSDRFRSELRRSWNELATFIGELREGTYDDLSDEELTEVLAGFCQPDLVLEGGMTDRELLARRLDVGLRNNRAVVRYRVRRHDAPVTLVIPEADPAPDGLARDWRRYAQGPFDTEIVPGHHWSLVTDEADVARLAEVLRDRLGRVIDSGVEQPAVDR